MFSVEDRQGNRHWSGGALIGFARVDSSAPPEVVWYNGALNPNLYAAALLAALPHTAAYAISNVIFLNLLGRPFGEKLDRVKIKYGV